MADKTIDQLYLDMIAWLKEATGRTLVIRGHEHGPQPKGSYISVLLIAGDMQGLPAILRANEDGETFDQVSRHTTEHVFSVQVYRGTDTMDILRKLEAYPSTPWGQEFLANLGISILSNTTPLQTDYEDAGEFIPRASTDITVLAETQISQQTNVVTELTTVIKHDDGLEETVTVP